MTKYIQTGDAVDYTPGADVSAGDVVVQGDLVGIAKLDIKTGKLGALAVTGVFDFPKATGTASAIAAGAKVYWNATNGVATTAANDGGNPATAYPYIGKTIKAAVDADALVRVRLSQ
jgi:predicted RecA/RadA family phage recombinase